MDISQTTIAARALLRMSGANKVVNGLKSFVLSILGGHLISTRRWKFNYNLTPPPHQSDIGVKCVKLSSSDPNIVLLSPGGGRTKIQF